jgi:hypothetical protein
MKEEPLTEDERHLCYGAYFSANSGSLACMTQREAARLQELGLLSLSASLEDAPDGSEFGFTMTDDGERVAREYRESITTHPPKP